MAEETALQELHPPKKRIKSAVWDHFGDPKDPKDDKGVVPVRTHFSTNEIPILYMEVRASIDEQIKEAEWFGATTDVWTSSGGSEQVHQLLQPLNELTDVMSSEKQVTLSSLKPVFEHIDKRILNEKEEDSALTKQMKKAGNFSDKLEDTVKACTQEAISLAPTPIPDEPAQPRATISEDNEAGEGTSSTFQRYNSIWTFAANYTSPHTSCCPIPSKEKAESEIKLYLSLPIVTADANPLSWWKMHLEEMPLLSKVQAKL
ncbi:hypothetical protein WMY93_017978 [Mugilogobius chulae]|uniref:HAT C-terminal dimerisation domain-containing protein n=1 Tax=Mugilogobius chulae TaxID=88201 RepID=A0AAW0NUU7_9GOBI